MGEKSIAVNIEVDLTKPFTTLIEKVSNAVGILYEPNRIKRKAEADAGAKILIAKADVKAQSIEQRSLSRLIAEETKKQANMENILEKSLLLVEQNAKPENLNDAWIVHFFEKSRHIFDEEMQDAWARILAGEVNSPGSYSKKTINLMAEMERDDALLFTKLSNFSCMVNGPQPLIYEATDVIYINNGIGFAELQHLESLGLIKFESIAGFKTYRKGETGGMFVVSYQGTHLVITIPDGRNSEVETGHVMYTQQGKELIKMCISVHINGFEEYILEKFTQKGLIVNKIDK